MLSKDNETQHFSSAPRDGRIEMQGLFINRDILEVDRETATTRMLQVLYSNDKIIASRELLLLLLIDQH